MLVFNDLPAAKPEYEQTLFGMARFILRTIELARREGILSLEGYFCDVDTFNKFVEMILQIKFQSTAECLS